MMARRRAAAAISLFSFQDIMAAVIGILFFIVLLLSLSMVDAVNPEHFDSLDVPTADVIEHLQTTVSDLDVQVRQAEREAVESARLIGGLAKDDRVMLAELRRMEATLKGMHLEIARAEGAAEDLQRQAEAMGREQASAEHQVELLEERLSELKSGQDASRSSPRVAFIIDPRDDKLRPWLIEITADRCRVAPHQGIEAVLEFAAGTANLREEMLLKWCCGQDRRSNYFVLLIKPSGRTSAERIESRLRSLGYQIGMDILPEAWEPF